MQFQKKKKNMTMELMQKKMVVVIFQICTKDENDDHRANGRAWGDIENREHYSNQLSGQVVYKNLYLGYH